MSLLSPTGVNPEIAFFPHIGLTWFFCFIPKFYQIDTLNKSLNKDILGNTAIETFHPDPGKYKLRDSLTLKMIGFIIRIVTGDIAQQD